MAFNHLRYLQKKLGKDPKLAAKVKQQLEDYYKRKGYIHRTTQKELDSFDPRRVWFLPLGLVKHPKKSKIRLVWDTAAHVDVSLYARLLKGPDFLVPLKAALLRFRQRKIAISGDIREMFLQPKMRWPDKQLQLFMYRNDPSLPPEVYVIDVVTFGAACSPSTAQYVKIRDAEDFAGKSPRADKFILKSHYVDDLLDSVDTEEEAIQLTEDVRSHSQGSGIRNTLLRL